MLNEQFGHYRVLDRLGTGGMGDVYRALDSRLGREVAIKFLAGRLAVDPQRLARFEQEARTASALNHPNIVTVHEIGQLDGRHYIVMELVAGVTLRRRLAEGALPIKTCLHLGAQLADGLAKAHGAGIVHRDVKPENLMVTDEELLKILDFGLAKPTTAPPRNDPEADTESIDFPPLSDTESGSPGSPETEPGVILGTVGYMSPEQARGQRVDFRSDQFGCGAILYEMACGERAFQADSSPQTLARIIESEPRPLQELIPQVPAPYVWIVERCLAKNPKERYASTLDLAQELRSLEDRLDDPATAFAGAPRSTPQRRWRSTMATVLVALLLVLGLLAAFVAGRARRSAPIPAEKQIAILPFAAPADDAESLAFSAGVAETLTSKLTQLRRSHGALWVIPASEVREAGVSSAAAARRALGASLVVTGSIQRTGDLLRVTANLVDATTLRQLRAFSLDASPQDLLGLQDGLVSRVAELLELPIDDEAQEQLSAGSTGIAAAYELYVRGRGFLQRYEQPESLDRAISAFQASLQRDPGFALAYAGLGEAQWRRFELTSDASSAELAQKSCQRALELNDLLAPVHVTLGVIHRETGRHDEALSTLQRALALDPGSAEALQELGRLYVAMDQPDQAEAAYKKAIALRPSYWSGHNHLGAFYWRQGRYRDAEREFRAVTELTPDNALGHSNLGGLLIFLQRYEDAETSLRRSVEVRPNAVAYSNLATVQFYRGDYVGAARSFEKVVALDDQDYEWWRNLAAAYYHGPGERHRARTAYQRALTLAERRRALTPKDPAVLTALADCHAQLDQPSAARELSDAALAVAPHDVNVLFQVGALRVQLGERRSGLRLIAEALEKGYPVSHARWEINELRADDPRFKGVWQKLDSVRQSSK
jgi:eukaryotic-like serine/threonine-protein kinase